MKTFRSEVQTKTRPSVERAFPVRRDLRSKAEVVKWEDGLTDWEWITLWAMIYSVELASVSEQSTTKH